jgi:hypothetical protein
VVRKASVVIVGAGIMGGQRGRIAAWIALAAALVLSLALVLTPMGLIQPFRAQTPQAVHLSYLLRVRSPSLTLALFLAAIEPAAVLLPRLRRCYGRGGLTAIVLLLGASAWLARQNHFEWMFHTIAAPRFAGMDGAHDLKDDDLVLGVSLDGAARAYPVRALAYHHVLNDEVGDRAVVATY